MKRDAPFLLRNTRVTAGEAALNTLSLDKVCIPAASWVKGRGALDQGAAARFVRSLGVWRRGTAPFALLFLPLLCLFPATLAAQEASAGFDLRATLSATASASGGGNDAGFRAVFYPTWKLSDHWAVSGAFQVNSQHYLPYDSVTPGDGVKGYLLLGTLNYSRIWRNASLLIRAGQMPTAFGSFPLRYDDADNPLIRFPAQYGYYYAPVSTLGLAGAQIDATRGRWDARLQLANSSPANPRSVFARDQYGNQAGGAGFTIRQGFRIGVSGYRGPWLDRQYRYFFPGEANPNELPAHAVGLDVEWARGHWNLQGELQKFVLPYKAIPVFHEQTGYVEVRRVLHPRWYIAARGGYTSPSVGGNSRSLEATAGFRPGNSQLIKFDYEIERNAQGSGSLERTFAVEVVQQIHPFSLAWK